MKTYDVFFIDGTFIEIEADCFLEEDGWLEFMEVPEDEAYKLIGCFNMENIAGFREVC